MITNFFITGSKNSGKSFLIERLTTELAIKPSGFITLPYVIESEIKGHYFHSMVECDGIENNLPFTIRHLKDSCIGVNDVFEILGVPCLKRSLEDKSQLVVMDEIGIKEEGCINYMHNIVKLLDSRKITLCALKKASACHLIAMKSRHDSLCVDLDQINMQEAYNIIKIKLLEALEK